VEALLERARGLTEGDAGLRLELDELLLTALAAAGKAAPTTGLGDGIVETLLTEGASPSRIAHARLSLAWAALASRDWRRAESHGLEVATIGAAAELAAITLGTSLHIDDLAAVRRRAEQAGISGEAALADLRLSWAHLMRAEPDPAFESLQRCLATSRRHGL